MNVVDDLTQRNAVFARDHFAPGLTMMPSMKTLIIGCVDPRVDPVNLLGLALGEAVVIRNVGGRVTPDTLATLKMLRLVGKSQGAEVGPGFNLIVLHHTDCGIKSLTKAPDLLAHYFGVAPDALGGLSIDDPYAAVKHDVAVLKADPLLPGAFLVTGLVFDVATGRIETAVPPALLRP